MPPGLEEDDLVVGRDRVGPPHRRVEVAGAGVVAVAEGDEADALVHGARMAPARRARLHETDRFSPGRPLRSRGARRASNDDEVVTRELGFAVGLLRRATFRRELQQVCVELGLGCEIDERRAPADHAPARARPRHARGRRRARRLRARLGLVDVDRRRAGRLGGLRFGDRGEAASIIVAPAHGPPQCLGVAHQALLRHRSSGRDRGTGTASPAAGRRRSAARRGCAGAGPSCRARCSSA